jgi:hypothetical protein
LTGLYDTTSVGSAVACLNAALQDVMEQAIPRGIKKLLIRNSNTGILVSLGITLRKKIRIFTDI